MTKQEEFYYMYGQRDMLMGVIETLQKQKSYLDRRLLEKGEMKDDKGRKGSRKNAEEP